MRLAVLVSGSGTILKAMLDSGLPVTLVISDRACAGLALAEEHGVPTELVDRTRYGGFGPDFDREGFTSAVATTLLAHGTDLVAMAGFGTVLTEAVHATFPNRILNTHPALLPAFPGWHAVRDALAAGVTETGCTVHVATLEMDAGPVLAQEVVSVRSDDTEETLHERIKVVERTLYPATVAWALGELEAGRRIEPPPSGLAGQGARRAKATATAGAPAGAGAGAADRGSGEGPIGSQGQSARRTNRVAR